ncbi:hypothetical protein HYALB_00007047 [Hymenoscyphus albidus]|uniref:polynucleotide adenylyltransferase n=1 Tax=Hymenoscyphus albidus TaxID=595503 RepID=A0A9N9LIP9_9HELO|nr:hypothetical protein HYALB_00007047 [Hymenoscyphus albidus]
MAAPGATHLGVTQPLSCALPTEAEIEANNTLIEELRRQGNYESASDSEKRNVVLKSLQAITEEFVKQVLRSNFNYPDAVVNSAGGRIFTYGSYRLGVYGPGSDIDTLVVVPKEVTLDDFFERFPDLLEKMAPKGAITELTPVPDSFVPIIKFEYSGISIDLIFCSVQLKQVPKDLSLLGMDMLRGLNEKEIRCLNGTRVTDEILTLVPQPAVFRTALRAIKLWAQRRAIYANIMGFPGGVAWAMMVARTCQLYPKATGSTLVLKFFRIMDNWTWPMPVLLKPIESGPFSNIRTWNPKVICASEPFQTILTAQIYHSDRMHLMPIITPAYPSMCATHNITRSTMEVIKKELKRGGDITDRIMSGKSTWNELFMKNTFFVNGYKYYITVIAASPTEEAQLIWSGLVESKVRLLVGSAEENEDIALVHPFNKGFERVVTCHNEDEIEKAKNGIEIPIREVPVETTDPAQHTNGDTREENGTTEKPTKIYTSTWYIGLQLHEGTKRLNIADSVEKFKKLCTSWEKYNHDLNALNVCTVKNCDLPSDVFAEGEVKPTRPQKKRKRGTTEDSNRPARRQNTTATVAAAIALVHLRSIPACDPFSSLIKPPKVAGPNPFRRAPHPHHRQSLLRYLFPHPRQVLRDRLARFRNETVPPYKLRAQSRIYRYIVKRQTRNKAKRAAGNTILDIVRRWGQFLFRDSKLQKNERAALRQVTMSGSAVDGGGYGEGRVPGARRKKLAGYLKAANDIRQSYTQSYSQKWNGDDQDEEDSRGIPGAFPDVAIVSHGDEQLVLFPSYARRHVKETPNPDFVRRNTGDTENEQNDEEYWAREWQKFEDDRAIVDVDVRGWIYSPHRGPMSRKNRVLIGLARQLSGIPAPKTPDRDGSPDSIRARHRDHEARRDQEKISREAEQILKKGQGEEKKAARGEYSEKPQDDSDESTYGDRKGSASRTPDDAPGPGHLSSRASWNHPSEMTQAQLATANGHLMARLRPFMTNPMVSTPITVFFYDEKTSVSRTVTTNDAGHFIMRAPLEFIPTHVRVLASEHLSATEEVKITEPKGVSLISDVDDTIKHSSISSGAREIFRNTFIRDLGDLTIDGVREWYNTMYDMGVGIHYVSNSPWQLFPVLVSFFQKSGLPPGSYHLKQYSGMLQGIFEPVAERKKGTLEKILRDFPERRFVLVGDSGEADLEVYTDVVLANPGKIIAVFIRDVTTPETEGFFDSAMGPLSGDRFRGRNPPPRANTGDSRWTPTTTPDAQEGRPALPKRVGTEVKPQTSSGPAMGTLIDFDDKPQEADIHESHRRIVPRSTSDFEGTQNTQRKPAPDLSGGRAPPPRPSKPQSLRGASMTAPSTEFLIEKDTKKSPPAPPPPRRSKPLAENPSHPLSKAQSFSDLERQSSNDTSNEGYVAAARNKVASAYNALPEVRSYVPGYNSENRSSSTASSERTPVPPSRSTTSSIAAAPSNITKRMSWNSTDSDSDDSRLGGGAPPNKKLDLWRQRWRRAKDILDDKGVVLRSWRRGDDVCLEAVQLVEKTMRGMGVEGYGAKQRGNEKTGEGGGEVKVKDLKK